MMNDLISRQAAIDALAKNMPSLTTPDGCGEFDHDIQVIDEAYVDCMQIIHELPSAQPEKVDTPTVVPTCEDTISRQDAIRVASGYCHPANIAKELAKLPSAQPVAKDINVPINDCISRKAVIDALKEAFNPSITNFVKAKIAIEDLPSAQSERQKGEWIDYTEDGYVECPFCHSATNCDGNKDELHFCFSCGADMREPEDIPMEYFESGGR